MKKKGNSFLNASPDDMPEELAMKLFDFRVNNLLQTNDPGYRNFALDELLFKLDDEEEEDTTYR